MVIALKKRACLITKDPRNAMHLELVTVLSSCGIVWGNSKIHSSASAADFILWQSSFFAIEPGFSNTALPTAAACLAGK